MQRHLMPAGLLALFALVHASCQDVPTSTPESPLFDIVDAVHGGGNEHFYWLPPMITPMPAVSGVFDAAAYPTVRICEGADSGCETPVVTFTTTSGLTVSDDEWYGVDWYVFEHAPAEVDVFRVSVWASGRELGFADLMIVDKVTGQLKKTSGGDYVLLSENNGRKFLKIRFRIELEGLVSWWPGDGNFLDVHGGNHLTVLGDVPFVSGIWGQAFSFTGTTDHANKVDGAQGIDALQTLTLHAWVRLDETGPADQIQRFVTLLGEKAVIRQDGINAPRQLHFYMNFDTPGDPRFRQVRVDGILQTECFHHVVGTYDGTTMRAYLDGVEVGSTPAAGTVADASGVELSFGATDEALHGALDEVMIFDRALVPSEIQAIYDAAGEGKCSPAGG